MSERELVAKGAKLMDRILPGWYNEVDLAKLDMSSGALCLLGQTFGVHNERCLAKELYPEEYEVAVSQASSGGTDFSSAHKEFGYRIGADSAQISKVTANRFINPEFGGMVVTLARKAGISDNNQMIQALHQVCLGHDNKCLWAEEIAARRAAEGDVR